MESYTKIIELYGIPACGKSTLANSFYSQYKEDCNIATSRDSWHEIKKSSVLKKIKSLHLKSFIDCYRLCRLFPRTEARKDMSIMITLLNTYIRNFQCKYSDYDIIINDSSLIQQIVSWERGENFHNRIDFVNMVNSYLDNFKDIIYVYCTLDVNIALKRIRHRGRNEGRLDKLIISNPDGIVSEYKNEVERFDMITSILEKEGKNIIRFDMNKPTNILVGDLYKTLQNLHYV